MGHRSVALDLEGGGEMPPFFDRRQNCTPKALKMLHMDCISEYKKISIGCMHTPKLPFSGLASYPPFGTDATEQEFLNSYLVILIHFFILDFKG